MDNKPNMKLYTEEQVKDMLFGYDNFEDITPIELPSKEEIEKMAIERFPISMEDFGSEKIDGNEYFRSIFIQGIECLCDKIEGCSK